MTMQESIISLPIGKQRKYNFQFIPTRVCIPIGMACNVKCKYCMRLAGKIREPKGLSDLMREFLKQLNPATTEAVIINGGEPLLYMDRIKEVFSLVPKPIHKACMTNGTLLTQEIVDYFNENSVELHFSHEGTAAKYLKGVDVLEDPKIVNLLNQIKSMRIYTILTGSNWDVVANYEYILSKLNKVEKLWYSTFPMFAFAGNEELAKGFDFAKYGRSIIELRERYPQASEPSSYHSRYQRNSGFMVLPDGSVASLSTLKRYGTVLDPKEKLYQRAKELGDFDYCDSQDCSIREYCCVAKQCATPFTCKAQRISCQALEFKRGQNVF